MKKCENKYINTVDKLRFIGVTEGERGAGEKIKEIAGDFFENMLDKS